MQILHFLNLDTKLYDHNWGFDFHSWSHTAVISDALCTVWCATLITSHSTQFRNLSSVDRPWKVVAGGPSLSLWAAAEAVAVASVNIQAAEFGGGWKSAQGRYFIFKWIFFFKRILSFH